MNHSFATQRLGATVRNHYVKAPTLNVGLRILNATERKTASALATFPEHARAVIAHLEPHQNTPQFDTELRKILKKARRTVSFSTH